MGYGKSFPVFLVGRAEVPFGREGSNFLRFDLVLSFRMTYPCIQKGLCDSTCSRVYDVNGLVSTIYFVLAFYLLVTSCTWTNVPAVIIRSWRIYGLDYVQYIGRRLMYSAILSVHYERDVSEGELEVY